jgi:hypothetical protein
MASKTGVKASYKKGGLEVEGEYNLADAMAGLAFLGGLGGFFFGPPGWAASAILLSGSGYYFGVNYIFPQHEAQKKLLTANNNRAVSTKNNPFAQQPAGLVLLGVGGAGIAWYLWKQRQEAEEAEEDEPAPLTPLDIDQLGVAEWQDLTVLGAVPVPAPVPAPAPPKAESPPAADLAPGGAGAPGAAQAPYVPPAEDTNLYWWPMEDPKEPAKTNTVRWGQQNLGQEDLALWQKGVKWATGAGEGEGYLPDDWTYGTKEKMKEGAKDVVKETVKTTTGHDPDEPLIPKWVLPVVVFGTLGLGFYWVSKR